ncbi:acyltransferase [Pseudoalteromonas sp. K222D]|uniref:acyltransferase n=1 Tax=Pseudoalteromonas sp. K222D TaxID=2820756 RepID=UPI001AD66B99|nr:acyltransferase [Pseudoalteromonas sp. K222D]MBO7926573.1 acyltransferase [Pseudoalteromonas sp. K222D]
MKLISYIDRALNKAIRFYRLNTFKSKVLNLGRNPNVLGVVHVNATQVSIGDNVTIYPDVYFWGDGEIIIGNNVDLGMGTIIFSKNKVVIGDNTSIAAHCYIIDSNHGISKSALIREQPLDVAKNGIIIGEDVWISAGSKIIKGAKINKGAVIGAMSLVNSDICEYEIAAGIPAKKIKERQ